MNTAGLRELRQQASDLVRRAEAGETIVVTVSGRPVAHLVPIASDRWRVWTDIAEVFDGPADLDWESERELVDQAPADPFER